MRRLMVAGNWKMNTLTASAETLAAVIAESVPAEEGRVDVLVCPPFAYLSTVHAAVTGSGVRVGAQNCYFEESGAFTGEISVDMLLDVGCSSVIIGHSERRHILGETDEQINLKAQAALRKGLQVILCVGELLSERESDQTESVLDSQMRRGLTGIDAAAFSQFVIAYEPVWAIGTGVTASPEQAQEVHAFLRNWLATHYNPDVAQATPILYGGSVKPSNAAELLQCPDVDGALVGGASLKADDFLGIVNAAVKHSSAS